MFVARQKRVKSNPAGLSPCFRDRSQAHHRVVENLLQRVISSLEASDTREGKDRWNTFESSLRAHMEIEERVISTFAHVHHQDARALLREHYDIRTRVAEIEALLKLNMCRPRIVRDLLDSVRAHAAHEDRMLYPWMEENLSDADKALIIDQLPPEGTS